MLLENERERERDGLFLRGKVRGVVGTEQSSEFDAALTLQEVINKGE